MKNEIEALKLLMWQTNAGIFLFGSLFLFIVGIQVRQNSLIKDKIKEDWGVILIAGGVFSWFISPILQQIFPSNGKYVSILTSTFNNGLFIAALPFFKHSFVRLRNYNTIFNNHLAWTLISIISCFIASMVLSLAEAKKIDMIFSIMVAFLFGYAVVSSFKKREYNYFSLAIIVTIFICYMIVQYLTYKIWLVKNTQENSIEEYLLRLEYMPFIIITASSMTGVLLLLANSWVQEEIETKIAYLEGIEDNKNSPNENRVTLAELTIDYDKNSGDKYIIILKIKTGEQEFFIRCANSRITVPHSNWIVFAIAKKNDIKLNGADMAQTKFQMIKYVESFSPPVKMLQENVFHNNGGEFELDIEKENVVFCNFPNFKENNQLTETFKKYLTCFSSETLPQNKDDREKFVKNKYNIAVSKC